MCLFSSFTLNFRASCIHFMLPSFPEFPVFVDLCQFLSCYYFLFAPSGCSFSHPQNSISPLFTTPSLPPSHTPCTPFPGSASPLPSLPLSRTPCAPFPGSASPPPPLPPSSSPHPDPVTPAFPPVSGDRAVALSLETLTCIQWEDGQGHQRNLEDMVSAEWRKFGIRVGLTMNRLKGWEKQFDKDSSRCWQEVMQHWLNDDGTQHYPSTWEGLYTLVRDCGFPEVAVSLQKALCTLH